MTNTAAVAIHDAISGVGKSINTPKKTTIIYWVTTGIISALMLLGAYYHLFSPQMKEAFAHLGFPSYFRVELGVAKIIGVVVLLVPRVPLRVKEWAYAGFGIVLISASLAHFVSHDPIGNVVDPLCFLLVLIASNVYLHKLDRA
ncbi:MAG TPA: DoxX family protein [Polyangiaceae bacterium]|nr:DoxX family protein [Polyangiaceae bacterium]